MKSRVGVGIKFSVNFHKAELRQKKPKEESKDAWVSSAERREGQGLVFMKGRRGRQPMQEDGPWYVTGGLVMSHKEGSWEKALCFENLYGDLQVVDTANTSGQSTSCHIWRWKKCHCSLYVTQMETLVQRLNKQGWEKRATTSDIEESGLRKRKMSKRASYFTPQNIR